MKLKIKTKKMKTSELKPEEILKVKYSDDKWEPDFKGILEAMREYAEAYHKAKLKEELVKYEIWNRNQRDLVMFTVDEYLKGKDE